MISNETYFLDLESPFLFTLSSPQSYSSLVLYQMQSHILYLEHHYGENTRKQCIPGKDLMPTHQQLPAQIGIHA